MALVQTCSIKERGLFEWRAARVKLPLVSRKMQWIQHAATQPHGTVPSWAVCVGGAAVLMGRLPCMGLGAWYPAAALAKIDTASQQVQQGPHVLPVT